MPWCSVTAYPNGPGSGPTLEEDIALSNLALDLIGQARLYYAYAGEIEGQGPR